MSAPVVEMTPLDETYWQGLNTGELRFQHCTDCEHNWLPARERCPNCLGPAVCWRKSAGHGRVVSWVVYHVAYHESLKDKIPYNVAIVELDEGPRLLTNIVNETPASPIHIDARVNLSVECEGEQILARFRLVEND